MARAPIFNFRLDDDAKARWQAAADEAGEGLSEFIRDAVEFRIANPNPYDGEPVGEPEEREVRAALDACENRRGCSASVHVASCPSSGRGIRKAFKGPDPKPASTKRERR